MKGMRGAGLDVSNRPALGCASFNAEPAGEGSTPAMSSTVSAVAFRLGVERSVGSRCLGVHARCRWSCWTSRLVQEAFNSQLDRQVLEQRAIFVLGGVYVFGLGDEPQTVFARDTAMPEDMLESP